MVVCVPVFLGILAAPNASTKYVCNPFPLRERFFKYWNILIQKAETGICFFSFGQYAL